MKTVYVFLIAIIVFIIAEMVSWHRQSRRMNQLAQSLSTKAIIAGEKYVGTSEGLDYYYQYYPGSKNQPSYFKVGVSCFSRGEFQLTRENPGDRFFRNLGICCEIQTGDPAFDREFYIQTDHVAFASAYFAQEDKRRTAEELFRMGFNKITHNGRILEVYQSPYSLSDRLNEEFILATVSPIKTLIKNIPQDFPQDYMAGIPSWKMRRHICYGIGILSLAAGFFLLVFSSSSYKPLDEWDVFVFSLKYSLPSFVLVMMVVVQLIKGRSSSHRELLTIFFICLFGVPMTVDGAVTVMNGYGDTASVRGHRCRIIDRYTTHSKSSTYYYIQVESWRKERTRETLDVPSSVYDRAFPGKIMDISTKPGRYGFEWLVGYHL